MTSSEEKNKPEGFQYLSCCGRGGFGEAWLVRADGMGPLRILKLLRKDTEDSWKTERDGLMTYYEKLEGMSPEERRMFVSVLHHGENQDYFYYTMEAADNLLGSNSEDYVPKTLANCLAQSRLTSEQILEYSLSILEALKTLRKHGIVHRDIKPQNIFFFNGRPALGDIGLMQSIDEDEMILALAGCQEFIPPEARSDGAQMQISGGEWDLYAFGKVLYSMDTGNDVCNFPLPNLTAPSENVKISRLWERLTAENKSSRLQDIDAAIKELRHIGPGAAQRAKNRHRTGMAIGAVLILSLLFAAIFNVLKITNYDTIFDAIEANSLPGVLRRIHKKDSLQTCNENQEYPITLALQKPDIDPEIIRELYERGSSQIGQDKISHLELAITHRQSKQVIDYLIEQTVRIREIKDSDGGNLLHTAIRMHNSDVFEELLQSLNANSVDRNGHSALMLAMHSQQYDIATLLLAHGASPDFTDKNGFTPLHLLHDAPEVLDIAQELLKSTPINCKNTLGETPLLRAVRNKAGLPLIILLLENGADPNIVDNAGLSPLAEAVALDTRDIFECLVKNGASINVQDSKLMTPLHIAAIYNRKEFLLRLLELKADCNAQDNAKRTALHRAAMLGRKEIVQALIAANASLGIQDALGLTAADIAAIMNFGEIAELLPPPQANADKLNDLKRLLAHFSIKHTPLSKENHQKLIALLNSPDFQLNSRDASQSREFYKLLIGEPDITPGKVQEDPIRLALSCQNTNILIKLLACAPDINIPDKAGITPVLATALNNKIDALQYLCFYGADISAKANGMDILELASLAKSQDIAYFAGICMIEAVMDKPLPLKTHGILIDTQKTHDTFIKYRDDNNIFTPDDFLILKIRKNNASAVARTIAFGYSTPNVETSIGKYAIVDEDVTYHVMAALLANGAQPNLLSTSGSTALCKAIYNAKQFYFIKLLLDYGADPLIKESNGHNAFQAADDSNGKLILQLLQFYCPQNN